MWNFLKSPTVTARIASLLHRRRAEDGLKTPPPAPMDHFEDGQIDPALVASGPIDASWNRILRQAAVQPQKMPAMGSLTKPLQKAATAHNLFTRMSNEPIDLRDLQQAGPHQAAFAEHPGLRRSMQDCHRFWSSAVPQVTRPWDVQERGSDCHLFGVFDGHGSLGHRVSEAGGNAAMAGVQRRLAALTPAELQDSAVVCAAIKNCFAPPGPPTASDGPCVHANLQRQVGTKLLQCNGSTALVAVVLGPRLYVACLGDSHAILVGRGGAWLPLSNKHQPACPHEADLLQKRGGVVASGRVPRLVSGMQRLSLSRALGDLGASPLGRRPQVSMVDLEEFRQRYGSATLVLGSDGIFDALSDHAVATLVSQEATRAPNRAAALQSTCVRLIEQAYVTLRGDNEVVGVVALNGTTVEETSL